MTDSMKFGPEWLRNLSSEGSTGGAPKYQLAEHRYGREEMLALFDRNVRAPDPLVKLQGLYVEKTQTPMALLTMTEEETKQWNKGINSDAVLRLSGKTLVGPPGGGLRGRGGSVDRGRGRPRGSGGFHYSRGLSYEEQSDGVKEGGPPERGFTRSIRSYERPQGIERSWAERNGGDSGDWNGSTSPRKEYSSMKDFLGGRSNTENWRRHRGTSDDEEGWRKSDKWGRSNSWRDENDDGGVLSKPSSRTSSWGRGWADEGLRGRSHDEDSLSSKRSNFVDEVPEWAMENPSESGGSFDASGAFHGGNYSDEEEESSAFKSARNRLSDDADSRNKSKKSNRGEFNDYDDDCGESNSSPKDRKLLRSQTAQGNLSEPSKLSLHSLSKSQSSSNLKTEPPETSSGSSKRTESQNFDRIRVQHQNFIDKNGASKDSNNSSEVSETSKKENVSETNGTCEEVNVSETSGVLESGISSARDKNSVFTKESVNNVVLNSAGMHIQEEQIDRSVPVNRQGSEEDMERMAEVVKDTVVKLFEDEEKPVVNVESDKWYYRDPQGVVQGPFRSSEMLEWFMNGYFALSLLVRREQDEIYVKLGDLMFKYGKIPFLPGVNIPVLKADSDLLQQPPHTPAQPPNLHGLSQPDLFMQQYHQYQILQKQFLLSQQLALNKLSQSEMWNTLSPIQQKNLIMQKLSLAQQPPITMDQMAQVDKNPLSQLIAQMQQNKMQIPDVRDTKSVDPLRQLLQNINVMQASQPPLVTPINPAAVMLGHQLNPQPHLNSVLTNPGLNQTTTLGADEPKIEDPIQSLLRQLGNQPNIMQPPASASTDSLWGAPGRTPHWAQPSHPVNTSSGLPLWEIKTEQQILAEQQLRLDEERRQEELRKRKEEEEEAAKKQKELEEKRREEEKKNEEIKRLELKRLEEEKIRLQKEKEKEERKKAEELKKKQQQEEAQKKKQLEMAKKMQEAQKKKEEKERKKEEEREKKRLLEEGKKKLENEKRKKEEEQQRLKKKQAEEEEEAAKKQEQVKKPIEALKKMQEQQMEPFKKPLPWSQPAVATTSLSDIQKMQEKEKKQQMLREQQQQLAQKDLQQIQKENESRSNGLNLKWAEQAPKINTSVKSLAEIQAEEQLQLAKQLEKERLERIQQQREVALASNPGIWGNASQSLTWTNSSTPWGVTPVQNNATPGFWDEVAPNAAKTKAKTPMSPLKGKSQLISNSKTVAPVSGTNQKSSKPKNKKEEAAVMKLFERLGDEFTAWCSASLQSIQSDVDIPTFVSFLRDIESPYEVTDYVKCYLGDGKEAQEFAKQFLERRSRWMYSQKANLGDDDKNTSVQPVNSGSQYQSNVAQEFQEVKGKGKKSKKGKMLKVDNRILGFSVTAAPDRINIGDRDYVNHNL